jgi:hypothetical protein
LVAFCREKPERGDDAADVMSMLKFSGMRNRRVRELALRSSFAVTTCRGY